MDGVTLLMACGLFVSGGAGQTCAANAPSIVSNLPVADSLKAQPRIGRWRSYIGEASRKFGIPRAWIRAVMRQESGGRTVLNGHAIVSPAGAMGLMQVMPKTYSDLRKSYGFGPNAFNPHDNILAGAAYLREMYDRYGYPSLFAAYNAGPKRFDAFILNGKPLPDETANYVESILPGVGKLLNLPRTDAAIAPKKWETAVEKPAKETSPSALFFARSGAENRPQSTVHTAKPEANSGGIFVHSNAQGPALKVASHGGLFVPLAASPRYSERTSDRREER